jgi:hypothetical protein
LGASDGSEQQADQRNGHQSDLNAQETSGWKRRFHGEE